MFQVVKAGAGLAARGMAEHIRDDGRAQCFLADVKRPGPTSVGLARTLAETLAARDCRIEDLKAETLVQVLSQEGPGPLPP